MEEQTSRRQKRKQRMKGTIEGRTFRELLIFTLIMVIAAVLFGLYLYYVGVRREYEEKSWILAKSTSTLVISSSTEQTSERILGLYERMTPEEQLKQESEAYQSSFARVMNAPFNALRNRLNYLYNEGGAVAGYIAAIDIENNRLVYICDGDLNAQTFRPPGAWDEMSRKDLETFMFGAPENAFDRMYGKYSVPAVITRTGRYGYRCTGCTYLYTIDTYPVMLFYDMDMREVIISGRAYLIQYLVLLGGVAVLAVVLILKRIRRKIVHPIRQLTDAAAAYTGDKREKRRSVTHFSELDIHTGDEIEELAGTMKDMEADIFDYVMNLTRVTAERERISTELDVARKIQEGMLPHIFPPFPEREEFDIYAVMRPAKEVGGDFYNFFLIDKDHLALVMADVAGKGIPAALFMMSSMILIDNYAAMEDPSPAKILESMNRQICKNNMAEMFVTVWLGILEISTGRLVAANAGHEYPAIGKRGEGFALFKDKHGFVVGGMPGTKYRDYELTLEPGDSLFQYTDGVPEASNTDNELFGTERMLEALNREPDAAPETLLDRVSSAIGEYSGEAPQFDDITMMCITYYGPGGKNKAMPGLPADDRESEEGKEQQ